MECIRIEVCRFQSDWFEENYDYSRPEYKICCENKPWATKLPLGWTVSVSVPVSELRFSAACHVFNEDDVKLAEVVKKW